jgi:HSP20 family protein
VYGTFERSFRLPMPVRAEQIQAEFKDGVLTLIVPKAEEAKPKQIEVKVS